MVLRSHALLAIAVVLTTACTAAGTALEDGALAANTGSLAMVRLERPESADPVWTSERAELGAAFVAYRGIDGRTVLALVGGHAVEFGECRIVTGIAASVLAEPDVDVELLDLGEIEVDVAGARTRALPRTFPDLAGVVRGAFYAEEATLRPAYADADEYAIRVAGAADQAGFSARVVAPAGFADLWLDGVPSVAGAETETPWELTRGADIEVRWDSGDPRDRVELDVVAGGTELQCAARDDGRFVIPGELSVALPADTDARFAIRRTRREPIAVAGFDVAWASVATSRVVRAPVR